MAMTQKHNQDLTINSIPSQFKAYMEREGFEPEPRSDLNVPYFPGEFNRLIEHERINIRLRGDKTALRTNWFEVAPALRVNDHLKVDRGRYATAFEILTWLAFVTADEQLNARSKISQQFLAVAGNIAGLSAKQMHVTVFGGGSVLGHELAPDDAWKEVWCDLGVPEHQVEFIRGPKNYFLLLGSRERCGPRCEVNYRIERGSQIEQYEVGTLIWDHRLVSQNGGQFSFEESQEHGIGAAIGLERLLCAARSCDFLGFDPFSSVLAELQASALFGHPELIGDF